MNRNNLYPVFLKVEKLNVLIVGGGYVAEEKLSFLLKSSPNASVTIVAPMFREGLRQLSVGADVTFIDSVYNKTFIENKHLVIATTDQEAVNIKVWEDCRASSTLVNVADNPPYCDFYMGGIVTKGNVKIAISTNGKSPTMAKRLREFFEEILPENIDDLVENLNQYRATLKGDFEEKVDQLNEFTKGILNNPKKQ